MLEFFLSVYLPSEARQYFVRISPPPPFGCSDMCVSDCCDAMDIFVLSFAACLFVCYIREIEL